MVSPAGKTWSHAMTLTWLPRSSLGMLGTFVVSSDGSATVQMWSAANPSTFPVMQITAEQPGDAGQHGQILLSGIAEK
jgi:hypothetical protein